MIDTTAALSHRRLLSGLLCLTGATLLISAYPPWNMGLITGWFALVPMMAMVVGASSVQAALLGWMFGFLTNLGIFTWIFVVPGFHWYHFLLLDGYLALYPALWFLIANRFICGSALSQIAVACAWVLLEYLRSHAGFLALPWITLAQSQVDNAPLLQITPLFGESAVTFLVVLGNLAIWNLASGRAFRQAWLCVLPVLGALAFGTYVLNSSGLEVNTHIRVGALGTDFPAGNDPPPDLEARLDTLLKELERNLPPGVQIIALPESSLVNPKLFPTQIANLQEWAKQQQVTMIAGVAEARKFDHPQVNLLTSPSTLRSGAWIVTPESGTPQKYEKSRLVPFAEEVPLQEWITWPAWLIPPIPEVIRGPAPRSYPIPGGIRVGIMICWESLFADHAGTLVNDDATLLVMLANEGWFADPAGAQHNLTARMRAAETHRSVVVASNMGPPLIIDPFGRVIAENLSESGMRWAVANLPIVTESTFYTRLGDVFVLGCGVFILVFTVMVRLRTRQV